MRLILDRRGLLYGLGAAALGLLGLGRSAPPPPPEVGALLSLLGSRGSARAVGRAYLAETRQEVSAPHLVVELWRELGTAPAAADCAELRRRLAHRVRSDFAEERVVWVSGWLLARTEARLCALAALV